MPKAFVGGGYGRGASPLSLWGGGLGVLHQDFFLKLHVIWCILEQSEHQFETLRLHDFP